MRTFAVGDIHGCTAALDALWAMIKTAARVFVRVVSDAGGVGVVIRRGVGVPASEPPAEDGDGPFAGR